MKELKTIGRLEYADFPLLELEGIDVKIDTGAYTSSLHCESIEKLDGNMVSFVLLDEQHSQYNGRRFTLPIVKETQVKSSSGHSEDRLVIKTSIKILNEEFDIFLTLANREDMKYPVLLGRKFLANKFIVDVRLKYQ